MAYITVKLRAEAVEQLRRLTRQLAVIGDADATPSGTLLLLLAVGSDSAREFIAGRMSDEARDSVREVLDATGAGESARDRTATARDSAPGAATAPRDESEPQQ
jgi:hypothetical protein